MSTWRVADGADLDSALLAIVLSNNLVEPFDIVCLEQDYLTAAKLELSESLGDTLIEDLKKTHVDIAGLDYRSLGIVALHISKQVCGHTYVRCKIPKIVELVQAAIKSGRLSIDEIDQAYLQKLKDKGLKC